MALNERPLHQQPTLPYPENPGQTHYEGCWASIGHHNCAVRELQLRIEVGDKLDGIIRGQGETIDRERKRAEEAEQRLEILLQHRRKSDVNTGESIVQSAIALMDQLNSFNDVRHPEVHTQLRRLQVAVSEYFTGKDELPDADELPKGFTKIPGGSSPERLAFRAERLAARRRKSDAGKPEPS